METNQTIKLESLTNYSVNYDKDAENAVKNHWDEMAKPLGGMGEFETIVARIAGLTGDPNYDINKRALIVACADHGVVKQNVTQAGSEITAILARILTTNDATVSHMAKAAKADIISVDMGIIENLNLPGLLDRRIAAGTNDISIGPAMSKSQAEEAIQHGINLVKDLKEKGYKIIATGEMGIGNTTPSSAMASVLMGLDPQITTGRGTGISDEGLAHKISVIKKAIEINNPDSEKPLDVLSKLGGFEIACMTGIFIGGALYNIPIIIDGVISAVAALCATRICPEVKYALIPSHISAEPASKIVLDELGLKPLITANMHLGEGSGAVAAIPLLEMAYDVYKNMVTLQSIDITTYKPSVG